MVYKFTRISAVIICILLCAWGCLSQDSKYNQRARGFVTNYLKEYQYNENVSLQVNCYSIKNLPDITICQVIEEPTVTTSPGKVYISSVSHPFSCTIGFDKTGTIYKIHGFNTETEFNSLIANARINIVNETQALDYFKLYLDLVYQKKLIIISDYDQFKNNIKLQEEDSLSTELKEFVQKRNNYEISPLEITSNNNNFLVSFWALHMVNRKLKFSKFQFNISSLGLVTSIGLD